MLTTNKWIMAKQCHAWQDHSYNLGPMLKEMQSEIKIFVKQVLPWTKNRNTCILIHTYDKIWSNTYLVEKVWMRTSISTIQGLPYHLVELILEILNSLAFMSRSITYSCLLLTGKGIFSYEYIDDLKLQDTRLPLPENLKVFSEVRPSQ